MILTDEFLNEKCQDEEFMEKLEHTVHVYSLIPAFEEYWAITRINL